LAPQRFCWEKPATFGTLNALRDAGVGGTGSEGKKGGGAADGAATNSLFRENVTLEPSRGVRDGRVASPSAPLLVEVVGLHSEFVALDRK
jgi:hypothetical protein